MTARRSTVLALACALLAQPDGASAACQQAGTLICGKGDARIASSDVLQLSRGGDFAPLDAGQSLRGGDRILVGGLGATLTLGPSCQTDVGPGSLVAIRRNDGRLCASIAQQTEPLPSTAAAVGLGLAGAATLGVAAGLIGNGGGGNRPVSAR